MIRKKIAILLIVLLLSSTVAEAKVISYELKTKDTKRKSYATEQLIDSFLDYKRGEDTGIYTSFLKDLKVENYIAFQHHSKKYVAYEEIMNAFLGAKEKGEKFDLEEFMIQAKGMDLNDSTLTEEEKEKAKDLIEQQQGGHTSGGVSKDEIKDTANSIESSMKSNMPEMSKQEIKDLNMKVTDGSYQENFWGRLDPYYRTIPYINEDTFSNLGIEGVENRDSKSLKTIDRRFKVKNKIKNELSKDSKYSNLFDLNNYEDFEGMSIDFSNLNKVNHEDFPTNETFLAETKEEFAKYGMNTVNGQPGHYTFEPSMCVDERLQHSFMWKPYLEKDFIETINKMRVVKGAKPLQYNVDLHAMARFSVKRSSMGFNHSSVSDANTHLHNQTHFRHWANGSVPYCKPYKLESDGWGYLIDGRSRDMDNGDHWLTKLEGNEKEIFNYKGKVQAMSDMDFIFDDAKQWLDFLEKNYNKDYASRGHRDYYAPYCKKMDFNKDLLDPSLTKIGVGVLCELPVCNADVNGATGFFIITE